MMLLEEIGRPIKMAEKDRRLHGVVDLYFCLGSLSSAVKQNRSNNRINKISRFCLLSLYHLFPISLAVRARSAPNNILTCSKYSIARGAGNVTVSGLSLVLHNIMSVAVARFINTRTVVKNTAIPELAFYRATLQQSAECTTTICAFIYIRHTLALCWNG